MKNGIFFTTIKGKFYIYNGLLFILIYGLITFFYLMTRDILLQKAEKNIKTATLRIALDIENSNHEAITISKMMAISQETGLFGKRKESIDFSKKILEKYPQFTGSYFAYEPNADLNDESYLSNKKSIHNAIDKEGRFLPYWFISKSKLKLSPLKDMETSLYYQGTKDKFYSKEKEKSNLTEPYFYEGKMILEYTTPIVINNEFVGISGVDKALLDVNNFLDKFKPYENSNYILISNKGGVIASSMSLGTKETFDKQLKKKKLLNKDVDDSKLDRKMLTFHINDTDYSETLNSFFKMGENEKLLIIDDALTGEPYYYSGTKVKTGDWTFIMRVSKDEITSPINDSLIKFSVILIIVFLIIIFMSLSLSKKISNIISIVIEASSKVAKGKFEIVLPDFSIYEINLLKNSIVKTALILKKSQENLEKRVEKRTKEISFKNIELQKSFEKLKLMQERLVESKKMASLGSLVAGVAHEINTPVGIGLTGITYLIEETNDIEKIYKSDNMSKEEFENFLSNTKSVCNQININLIRTADLIRSFKQIAIDQTNERIRVFNLTNYIDEVLLSIKNITKKTNLAINVECDTELKIESFPGAYSQIISNLIINSIRHGFEEKEKGNISIEVVQEDKNIRLIYKDNGRGIEKKNIKNIFEPFFTTNREYGGTGLGLNVIYNIVTSQLNGTIECKSEQGEGVKFIINIPT